MIIPSVHHSVLQNGIRIVTQPTPGLQGVSMTILVASGATDEPPELCGAAHFIEHMMFKGTERRTSLRISSEFDGMGIDPNAGTSQEFVYYYFTTLPEYLPKAFDILGDMYRNSTFPEDELETERMVILEEIKRAEDDHNSFHSKRLCSGLWGKQPLGRPVVGTAKTVSAMTRDGLMAHMRGYYLPSRTVVAAAGNVSHDDVVRLCEEHLGGMDGNIDQRSATKSKITGFGKARHSIRKMEQAQFYLTYPSIPVTDPRYWGFRLMNNVLGSGMSSRLFREVREVRGLAYAVGSTNWEFRDGGVLLVYAGCDPTKAQEAIDVCHGEVMRLAAETLTLDALADAKRQARGRLLLGLDSSSTQSLYLANELVVMGRPVQCSEDLAAIEAVTPDMIREIAGELFSNSVPRLESIGPKMTVRLPS